MRKGYVSYFPEETIKLGRARVLSSLLSANMINENAGLSHQFWFTVLQEKLMTPFTELKIIVSFSFFSVAAHVDNVMMIVRRNTSQVCCSTCCITCTLFLSTPQLDNRQLRYWYITFYCRLEWRNCIGHCVT